MTKKLLLILLFLPTSLWAAITHVQTTSAICANGTSCIVTVATPTAGSFLHACVVHRTSDQGVTGFVSAIDHVGASWQKFGTSPSNGSLKIEEWFAEGTNSLDTTIAFNLRGEVGGVRYVIIVSEFLDVRQRSTGDTHALTRQATGSGTTLTTGTFIPAASLDQDRALYIACNARDSSGGTFTPEAGWIEPVGGDVHALVNPDLAAQVEYRVVSTAEDAEASSVSTSSGVWAARLGIFKESCESGTCNTLTMARSGSGRGTVTASATGNKHDMYCGNDCVGKYKAGDVVTLTHVEGPGTTWTNWTGDADCTDGFVTMSTSVNCTANFAEKTKRTLIVTRAGSHTTKGDIWSDPNGIACGQFGDCTEVYYDGDVVNLYADPDPGANFTGFTGTGCDSAGSWTKAVTMSANITCTATFDTGGGTPYFVEMLGSDGTCDGLSADPATAPVGGHCAKRTTNAVLNLAGFSCAAGDDVQIGLGTSFISMSTFKDSCNGPSFNNPIVIRGVGEASTTVGIGSATDDGAFVLNIPNNSTTTHSSHITFRDMTILGGDEAGIYCDSDEDYCTEMIYRHLTYPPNGLGFMFTNEGDTDAAINLGFQFTSVANCTVGSVGDGNWIDQVTVDGDETLCYTSWLDSGNPSNSGIRACGSHTSAFSGGGCKLRITHSIIKDLEGVVMRASSRSIVQDIYAEHVWGNEDDATFQFYNAEPLGSIRDSIFYHVTNIVPPYAVARMRRSCGWLGAGQCNNQGGKPPGMIVTNTTFISEGMPNSEYCNHGVCQCVGVTGNCAGNTMGNGWFKKGLYSDPDDVGDGPYGPMTSVNNIFIGYNVAIHTSNPGSSDVSICPTPLVVDGNIFHGAFTIPIELVGCTGTVQSSTVHLNPSLDQVTLVPADGSVACAPGGAGYTDWDGHVANSWAGALPGTCGFFTPTITIPASVILKASKLSGVVIH